MTPREVACSCRGIRKARIIPVDSTGRFYLVAEWIHFTRFGIRSPTIKLKVYTYGGL